MLKLHGFAVSNYYNKVKMALLEKGVPFEEALTYPTASPEVLERSPMGKVPFVVGGGGALSESQTIVEYLEDIHPEPPLYPRDAFARAKCRELIQHLELYLELPARRLYPQAFFDRPVPEWVKDEVRIQLGKAVPALARLARFDPFIAGREFTLADCAAANHLPLVRTATQAVLGRDLLAAVPPIDDYLARIRERPSARRVSDDREAGMEAFIAVRKQAAR